MTFHIVPERFAGAVLLSLENSINDEPIVNIHPKYRRCRLAQEEGNKYYRYYSYSTCATECLRAVQIKHCSCIHHTLIIQGKITRQSDIIIYITHAKTK